ncbi:MAG: alpha/beta hydrolase [Acidobacteria bacterium]|nr:MAG: alpha/beta hydrolase [Acidobacteriota bacterium]REK06096.1 MAG: alpha/beta hydrolase [Acidobacteriota bacterium]
MAEAGGAEACGRGGVSESSRGGLLPMLVAASAALLLAGALQAVSLVGRVTDPAGAALEGVLVSAAHAELSFGGVALSDAEGAFEIPDLAPGPYVVAFEKQGRLTSELEITLTPGASISLEQQMRPALGFSRAPTRRPRNFVTVDVRYATDRSPQGREGDRQLYSAHRGSKLRYGVAQVTIPRDHRLGEFEQPKWWKLEFRPDPAKHVTLASVVPQSPQQFAEALAEGSVALVFVHGFNVAFEDAVMRTGQLSYDLRFNGVPILYSWPSNGRVQDYVADQDNAARSSSRFAEFLELLASSTETAHVIVHSMGNQVLTGAVAHLEGLADAGPYVQEVALVAPDVDAGVFGDFAEKVLALGSRTTLYVSANDRALIASKTLRGGYPRLGDFDSQRGPFVMDGLDTIDVSQLDSGFLGHSYYGDNRSVISDLFHLLSGDKTPADRGLQSVSFQDRRFWRFVP